MKKTKMTIAAIALVLTLTFSATFVALPIVSAHDPPWSIKTYAYVSVSPESVGVGQPVLVMMWTSISPVPTASGAYGDRWHGFKLEVTKPDGTTQTVGTYDSDPIGFQWTMYTPDQTGTYSFKFTFPGQTLAGENLSPVDPTGQDMIGDYFEGSSAETTLTVQEDPILPYPETPLPTDYWTRPISGEHREWWSISGNWPSKPRNSFARYTEGPETAHILWAKPITFGGLVGGEFGVHSYHDGNAYEGKWSPPVIINGVLYYNKYPADLYAGSPGQYPRSGPKPGFYAVDLRTGEELYYNNDTRIEFGQILMYDSPNQHGAFAYLWAVEGSTWHAYDAYTGDYVYSIENVPSGLFGMFGPNFVYGSDGSILAALLGPPSSPFGPPQPPSWLALWNSSAIPELIGAPFGTENWQWRPYGKTVDGNKGYSWNVSIPAGLKGSINYVLEDRVIGSNFVSKRSGMMAIETENFTVWALSLKPGEQGKLLWKKDYTEIQEGISVGMSSASLEDGVFTVYSSQTRQYWGYSIDNGELLWGPTDSQTAWDYTVYTMSNIAYGRLFSVGFGGIVYCYNVTTGNLLWTYEATDPYYLEAKWAGHYPLMAWFIADGKIYVGSGEHSPDDPKERGSKVYCIDIESGDEVWKTHFYISHWAMNPAIADGIIVYLDIYDNRIYAFGKGQTETTVTAPDMGVPLGSSVMIRGTVTDQSAGAKDTPAISDEYMSEWMEYVYKQFPAPMDATGVSVHLEAFGADGSYIDIGRVTSDGYGMYKMMWTPEAEGEYSIAATFEGSKSYWASYAETAIGVGPAPTPYPEAPSAEEVAQKTIDKLPTYPEAPSAEAVAQETINKLPPYPEPPEIPEIPAYLTIDLAIIAAVAVAIIIGLYSIVKKQK